MLKVCELDERKIFKECLAYLGIAKGHMTLEDAVKDKAIFDVLMGVDEEIRSAYMEMRGEREKLSTIEIMKKEFIADEEPLLSICKCPVMKISSEASLIKAALFIRNQGIYPYYITKVIAAVFAYQDSSDKEAEEIRRYTLENGIRETIRHYTGYFEPDLIYHIKRHFMRANGGFVAEDTEKVKKIRNAYEIGFKSEKQYRGCAQGVLNALRESTGIDNKELFRAATGFSGGMSLCGDGVCGGYSGGLMFMSYLRGRDFDRIPIDGDKENQYFAYECSQMLHDRFIDCFGSPICMKIHEGMFNGEHYILRTKPRRNEFEDAGAHTVVCTTVVGIATSWVVEILMEKSLIS